MEDKGLYDKNTKNKSKITYNRYFMNQRNTAKEKKKKNKGYPYKKQKTETFK